MPRNKDSDQFEPVEAESSQTYYKAKEILGEKKTRGVTQYLVDWEGKDPETGKAYNPSWVGPADAS